MLIYEALESPYAMRVGEGGMFELDTAKYGGSPQTTPAPTVSVKNAAGTDVTSSTMAGSCTVFQDLIYLPKFLSTLAGTFYITIQFFNAKWNPARPMIRVDVSE